MTPMIMVAPNGARLKPEVHPGVPVTDDALIEAGRACHAAGAHALHAHLRDGHGDHLLDAARYQRLLSEFGAQVPGLKIQVTSEAAGLYSSDAQIQLLRQLQAPWVSLAVREITRQQAMPTLMSFFSHLSIDLEIQFILYDPSDLHLLWRMQSEGVLGDRPLDLLYVLGRYTEQRESTPAMLDPFLAAVGQADGAQRPRSQMVCAFGRGQIDCLRIAAAAGLDLRVGFENGIWRRDGSIARSNVDLIDNLHDALGA